MSVFLEIICLVQQIEGGKPTIHHHSRALRSRWNKISRREKVGIFFKVSFYFRWVHLLLLPSCECTDTTFQFLLSCQALTPVTSRPSALEGCCKTDPSCYAAFSTDWVFYLSSMLVTFVHHPTSGLHACLVNALT